MIQKVGSVSVLAWIQKVRLRLRYSTKMERFLTQSQNQKVVSANKAFNRTRDNFRAGHKTRAKHVDTHNLGKLANQSGDFGK